MTPYLSTTLSNSIRALRRAQTHLRPGQILIAADLGFDQVIAVDGGGNRHLWQAAADELEHGHLRGGVLHGHAVGVQAKVSTSAIDLLVVGVIEVAVYDLL